MNCSPPGSSVLGISQARILEWVAISSSRGSSWPRDRTWVSCIGRQIVYHWRTWELCCVLVVQSCLTLCDLVDYSLPGSSVHGILQVRIRGVGCHFLFQGMFLTQGSNPGLLHCRQILYWLSYKESPCMPFNDNHTQIGYLSIELMTRTWVLIYKGSPIGEEGRYTCN